MNKHWIFTILLGGLVLAVGFCFLASNIYYNIGMEHLKHQTGNPGKEFRMAIRLNPFNAEAHYQLSLYIPRVSSANSEMPIKENQEIEKELRWTIFLNPNHAKAHYLLGSILSQQGKNEEAVKEYRQALRLNPNDYLVHWELAKLLRKFDKMEEAEKEYRAAIRLIKPEDFNTMRWINGGWIRFDLVDLLEEQGKYQEAERELIEIGKLYPSTIGWHRSLAHILEKQGRFTEAEREYREAIREDPYCYGNLGILLAREGKYKAAEDTIRQGLRLNMGHRLQPEDPDLLWKLGCCYALWGKKERALVYLQAGADYGFSEWSSIEKDVMLNGLCGDSRFKKIADKVKENSENPEILHKYPRILP